jgi:misacylated tRNA(Ala) deacylase
MTEKLYLNDSYVKECSATVQYIDGNFVVLDKTIFYPQGGGQPTDKGLIVKDGKEYHVQFVKGKEEAVSHEVDQSGLQSGDRVHCMLDWDTRYKYMRMHTTAHILSKVIHDEIQALITGNQLGLEESRMDFSLEEFDRDYLKTFETKANEVIQKGLDVSVSFMPVAEALKKPELVRLKDIMPKALKEWRIVSIGDYDVQADGGTHVQNTKEIGNVKIIKVKNKGANNRRLYFTVE